VSATGILAYVAFDVIGAANASSSLTLSNVSLNDGAIASQVAGGSLTVNDLHAISGLVRYWSDNTAIAGVAVFLEGEASSTATTGSNGAYAFADLRGGDYTLMPDNQADVRQITAYDAALVLQAAAGTRTLSANESLAADVNRRDGVSALDAAYILQKSVGLIPGTFPNAGTHWVFTPAQRTYTALAADQVNQHFTGVLLGDVSGNWATGAGGSGVLSSPAAKHQLTIGSAQALPGEAAVRVPVRIARASAGVYAADLTITYDSGSLTLADAGVSLGLAATGMSAAVNASIPGIIRVALASANPIASDGDLLNLQFSVAAERQGDFPVAFSVANINEGSGSVVADGGAIVVTPAVTVAAGQQSNDAVARSGSQRIVKLGTGRLVLDLPNSHSGGTVVSEGEVVVRHASALGSGTLEVLPGARVTFDLEFGRVNVSRLVVRDGATLDIRRGGLTLAAGSASAAEVRALLTSSRNGGNWDGPGIATSEAASGSRRAVGYRVMTNGSIVVAWAAFGDVNLDGLVNSTDVNMILTSGRYGTTATDGGWWQGDFNYDGRVNATDINLLITAGLFNASSYRTAVSGQAIQGAATGYSPVLAAAFGVLEPEPVAPAPAVVVTASRAMPVETASSPVASRLTRLTKFVESLRRKPAAPATAAQDIGSTGQAGQAVEQPALAVRRHRGGGPRSRRG